MGKAAKRKQVEETSDDRCGHDGERPEHRPIRDFVYVDGARKAVEGPQNINTDRIEWLFAHGRIEERQWAAARKLEEDWELSLIEPRASTVLVGASGGKPQLPNDVKVAAMKRHGAARIALGRGWAMVELVVEQRKSVEAASAALRLDRKIGMGYFQLALHYLADHYGIPGSIPDRAMVALGATKCA